MTLEQVLTDDGELFCRYVSGAANASATAVSGPNW